MPYCRSSFSKNIFEMSAKLEKFVSRMPFALTAPGAKTARYITVHKFVLLFHIVTFYLVYSSWHANPQQASIQIIFHQDNRTHFRNTQVGGDATKRRNLKNVEPCLQLKTTANKGSNQIQKQAKNLLHVQGIICHWQLNNMWWFVMTVWKV